MKAKTIFSLIVTLIIATAVVERVSVRRAKAATFAVTTTTDNGDNGNPTPGSLRKAIIDANASAGTDTITFSIGSQGSAQTIVPPAALPNITSPVIIDGWSQGGAGYTGPPLIELNGASAGLTTNGLVITSGNSTVQGLVINRFGGSGVAGRAGIVLQTGGGNLVRGNYIGLDASGNTSLSNGSYGVDIEDSANNTIGGTTAAARNVISGTGTAIQINGATSTGTLIKGNYLGTNSAGTSAVSNSSFGVSVNSSNNIIGDTTPGGRNVISGNSNNGVALFESLTTGNVIRGNYIGTNAAGTAAISNGTGILLQRAVSNTIGGTAAGAGNVISGNSNNGISIFNGSGPTGVGNLIQGNLIGTNAAGTSAVPNMAGGGIFIDSGQNNTIGGTTPGARNIVSGNTNSGIVISSSFPAPVGNVIQGNFIGTDITGTAELGNGGDGVRIVETSGGPPTGQNTIGGTTPAARNIISSNGNSGINVLAHNTLVEGNFIGTDVSGTNNLGNGGAGVELASAFNTIIGGASTGAGNLIAFSGLDGVRVFLGVGNAIRGNSIFSNTRLGVNLSATGDDAAGVTQNDLGDSDAGSNNLQNFPYLTSAFMGCGTTVSGTLNSTPNSTFAIDFFANPSCDATCQGEGKTFLGSTSANTDPSGDTSFTVSLSTQAPGGSFITATATDSNGNTSEFSQCMFASSLSRTRECFTRLASPSSVGLTVPVACFWTAASNDPWIHITSANSGTGSATISFSLDANPAPTRRSGTLTIAGETFTVLQGAQFSDVPVSHPFFNEIGRISALGITLGYVGGTYRPDNVVPRQEMAAFIIRARGEFSPPTPGSQRFDDVPPSNPFYAFIDRLAVLQITLGCNANNYCPFEPVLREQMAAFMIRGIGIFNPPPPSMQRFADVPPTNQFYAFIDQMAARGITLGCGGGNYCPQLPVTRGQMAAFLIRAFGCGDPMCISQ